MKRASNGFYGALRWLCVTNIHTELDLSCAAMRLWWKHVTDAFDGFTTNWFMEKYQLACEIRVTSASV